MSRKSLSISASVLGAVLVALVALFIRNTGTTNAGEVQIKEEGVVSHSAQADDALAAVSQRVGFQVKLPPSVPKSLELKFVDSLLGPAGLPNSMNLGILSYGPKDGSAGGRVVVRIEQAGVRFGVPDGRAQGIDLGVPGADFYYQATERAVGYWAFTADRGYLVTVTGSERPSEVEIREMVASLVR